MEKTKDKILKCAENVFLIRGYKTASLQILADQLEIKPASLYYHFPGGKEEIYLAVLRNRLDQYRSKISSLSLAGENIDIFLKKFAEWFIEQPPMNMALITEIDVSYLTAKAKKTVMTLMSNSIFVPLSDVFSNFRNDLKNIDPMRLVGFYVNLLSGMSFALNKGYTTKNELVRDGIEIMLRGAVRK